MGLTLGEQVQLRVREASQTGQARREAAALAASLGFGEERAGRLALVVTELASNLVKHAAEGAELFVAPFERGGVGGVEVVALDRGPGIADARAALLDGYSTAGSPGTGLGAVSRLSDEFDLYSTPGQGTVVLSRVAAEELGGERSHAVGGICASKDGQRVSGDAFAVARVDGRPRIIVADGLGHGPGAHEASAEALRVFRASELPLVELIEAIHGALRATRGAAVAVAEVDAPARKVTYVGLGNISATIVGPDATRSLVSHNGTAGLASRRIEAFSYEIPRDALLVLHTDGLRARWSLADYPGLAQRDTTVVAATLYRDFRREHDDATAVVARLP